MFVSCAEMIFTMLLFPKQLWYCIGIIVLLVTMAVLLGIDNQDPAGNDTQLNKNV